MMGLHIIKITKMANRTIMEVTAQILEIAKEGEIKTRIVYGAYMSWNQLKEYLSALTKGRLIEYIREEQKYRANKKGMEYLITRDKLNAMTSSVTITAAATKEII